MSINLGSSSEGRPIRAFSFGSGGKTLLAWGYPHPDEPLGTIALMALGDGLLSGELKLDGWRVVIVLCADPDQVARQLWLEEESAKAFVRGCWRPAHLGLEVDYGFPIDHDPFYQPPDYKGRPRLVMASDEEKKLPYPPLPESLALASAIDIFEPELVASMHSTHSGGDYTFLLQRPSEELAQELIEAPGLFGRARHLGEPIDRGRKWKRDCPDLIREPTLEGFVRKLKARDFYDDDYLYSGNHSAAAYLQSVLPESQFICPEAGQFTSPEFECSYLLKEKRTVRESFEVRPKAGLSRVRRIKNERGEEIIYEQERVESRGVDRHLEVEVSRGMLGCLALDRRRSILDRADRLWEKARQIKSPAFHPYQLERENITVPGSYVSDGAMLIFRSREDYRRRPTRAQAACFNWRWPLHTAALLGGFQGWLSVQDDKQVAEIKVELNALQDECLASLPAEMLSASDKGKAAASMLARVLICTQGR